MTWDPSSSGWWFALTGVLLLCVAAWRGRRRGGLRYSSTLLLDGLPRSLRQRLVWLPMFLRVLCLGLIVVCLARPQIADRRVDIRTDGIAIQLVIDRSLSMQARDFQIGGYPTQRITAVKRVAADFVLGTRGDNPDDALAVPGRPNDLIGLVVFNSFADVVVPLTASHDALVRRLGDVNLNAPPDETGTAIGDALGLAVERLVSLEQFASQARPAIRSRVIILLTDGENNAGQLTPLQAAELAMAAGIRVYTIGIGTQDGDPRLRHLSHTGFNDQILRDIAAITGGQYFAATDTEGLARIYQSIDQLEKTDIVREERVTYRELALEPFTLGGYSLPALLAVTLVLLAAELTAAYWLRRLD